MKNNLRTILAEQKKTVADIHLETGISKSTLTNIYYERSENPSSGILIKIAEYLGVTLTELMGV